MRIIIVGAGKLGYSIADFLAQEQYDVVVVEQNEKRREIVQNKLDVLTMGANGASPLTMMEKDIYGADILIAVTDSDEVNMVACMLAKKNNIKYTVARIRNLDYLESSSDFVHEKLGIDLVLNPEQITALEIKRIIMTPSALDVEDFAEGKVRMFETRIKDNSNLIDIPLTDLNMPPQILIAMIFRKSQMIIPHGKDSLQPLDNVFFVGKNESIRDFEKGFASLTSKVERAMIIGAGRVGRFLAPMLEEQGISVKIIDKDIERCRIVAQKLDAGIALCGDGADIDFLVSEGVEEADVVICLTEDDKLNLLLALLAKHLGAGKTIVRVERGEYIELMEKVGVDTVLSTRLLSAGEVLRFVRRGGIVSVSLLEGAKAEAIEILLPDNCKVINKKLMHVGLPPSCLICAVVHDNNAIVPNGNTVLHAGDRIIIFVQTEFVKKIMPFFVGKEG